MSVWSCPICKGSMHQETRMFRCISGHTFDIAKSGYVNLLPVQKKKTKNPGDNIQMVRARRSFLDKGYYSPLLEKLCQVVKSSFPVGGMLLDAGCGEGYYTSGVFNYFNDGNFAPNVYGVDISKYAVDIAAKQCKQGKFAVGSIFNLPVSDKCCNAVMSLFAPYCGGEFHRVLKSNGIMTLVIPNEYHLIELKQAIYDKPYLNEVKDTELEGFCLKTKETVDAEILLSTPGDIQNLFAMTPYYYKTGRKEQEKLFSLTELKTQISFIILQYQKKG